ncbi:suppressor of tub2 mutation [Microbotryomycetes sp. JL201]|nr:suppressor of tub2 mutation [Microbotryomycetes sp. JL201]
MDLASLEQQLASQGEGSDLAPDFVYDACSLLFHSYHSDPLADNERRIQGLHAIRDLLGDRQQALTDEDLDRLSQLVKPHLRHNNQHVVSAALQTLPHLFSRAAHVDVGTGDGTHGEHRPPSSVHHAARLDHEFKSTLATLLPTEKLADSKQGVRDAAREAIVAAARASLLLTAKLAPPAPHQQLKDTSWQLVEQRIQEHAFQSKNAKAREQAILFLVTIRQSEDGSLITPLRPFTPLLLPLLGDPDPTVRSLALSSTISIFSAPTVSAAARADLKKLMLKLEVNKKLQDTILAAVLGGGEQTLSADNEMNSTVQDTSSQDARPRPRPPSPASLVANLPAAAFPTDPAAVHQQPAEIGPVYVANERDLHSEIEQMRPCFEGKETEHNWVSRDKSVARLRGLIKGGAPTQFKDAFLADLRLVEEGMIKTSSSLRTTLAISALQLMAELSDAFGSALDHHFLEPFLCHCLGMAGQTKKIVATASQATVTSLITNSRYHFQTIQQLALVMQDKNASARQYAAAHLQTLVKVHGEHSQHAIETSGGLGEIEQMLKRGLSDPNSGVKETSRTTFWLVQDIWSRLADKISCSLDSTSRKQLDKSDPRKQSSSTSANDPKPAVSRAQSASAPVKTTRPSVREMMLQAKREKAQKEQEMEAQLAAHAAADTIKDVAAATVSTPSSERATSSSPRNTQATPSSSASTPLFKQERPHLQSSPSSPTASRRTSHIPVAIGAHRLHRSPDGSSQSHHDLHVGTLANTEHGPIPASQLSTPAVATRHVASVRQSDVFNDSPDGRNVETFGLSDKGSDWWTVKSQSQAAESNADAQNADGLIARLMSQTVSAEELEQLMDLSRRYPVVEDDENESEASPSQRRQEESDANFWTRDKTFAKAFAALTEMLSKKTGDYPTTHETALRLLASLVEHQLPCLAGEETTLFELLLSLREDSSRSIVAATEEIGRTVTDRSEPLLTLGLLSSALVQYLDFKNDGHITPEIARAFALGLRLIGRLFAKLPKEILEDELPKRAELVKRGLNDSHSELRRASVQCLVDAHSVLRDQEKVYDLVGRTTLHKDQINLLSYYMSKTSV